MYFKLNDKYKSYNQLFFKNIAFSALYKQLYLQSFSGCSVARLSRRVWDAEVAGSNPATPTKHLIYLGMWRSLVAHTHGVRGVAGSNPVIPTKKTKFIQYFFCDYWILWWFWVR